VVVVVAGCSDCAKRDRPMWFEFLDLKEELHESAFRPTNVQSNLAKSQPDNE
jgi:hypothetical protein